MTFPSATDVDPFLFHTGSLVPATWPYEHEHCGRLNGSCHVAPTRLRGRFSSTEMVSSGSRCCAPYMRTGSLC